MKELRSEARSRIAVEQPVSSFSAFFSHPGCFTDAVTLAVTLGGDTDTIAAMTGVLAGTLLGGPGIPSDGSIGPRLHRRYTSSPTNSSPRRSSTAVAASPGVVSFASHIARVGCPATPAPMHSRPGPRWRCRPRCQLRDCLTVSEGREGPRGAGGNALVRHQVRRPRLGKDRDDEAVGPVRIRHGEQAATWPRREGPTAGEASPGGAWCRRRRAVDAPAGDGREMPSGPITAHLETGILGSVVSELIDES